MTTTSNTTVEVKSELNNYFASVVKNSLSIAETAYAINNASSLETLEALRENAYFCRLERLFTAKLKFFAIERSIQALEADIAAGC